MHELRNIAPDHNPQTVHYTQTVRYPQTVHEAGER